MEATAEEKFDAAVKVIQSIPRNGAFQPSSSLLLRFYGYYKQATMGPCDIPRPAFYDVMGKAKWDAWNKLGNMSKEEAMNSYVEELKNIIEAMPHTDKVSAFISKLGDFYELVDEKIGGDYRRIKPALHLNGDVKNCDNNSGSDDIMTKMSNEADVNTESQMEVYNTESHTQSENINNKQLTADGDSSIDSVTEAHIHSVHNVVVTSHNITTSGDDDDDDGSETDEFCDTLDSPTQPELTKQVSCDADHNYSAAPVTIMTMLTCDASSTSLGISPHQLYDKNWSTVDLQSLETQTKMADTLVIGEKDLIDDVKSTLSRNIESNSNTPKQIKDSMPATGTKSSPGTVAGRSSGLNGDIPIEKASNVSEQLVVTVRRLQDNMKQVTRRLEVLEKYHNRQQKQHQRQWWPFGNIPTKAALFFIIWPFIVHWLLFRRRSSLRHQ